MSRLCVPLIFGVIGVSLLMSLGFWQLRRLAWKEAILARIEGQINRPPVALPADPQPPGPDRLADPGDLYLPVALEGWIGGPEIHVLVSTRTDGPGLRVISALRTADGRRVLLDRGFLPETLRRQNHAPRYLQIIGNLNWPDEIDAYTPPPDPGAGLWFARDIAAMAKALNTEPVLVVAKSDTGDQIRPLPVDMQSIPNDHLGYALQWFGLAIAWAGMTAAYLWRITRAKISGRRLCDQKS
jgi:surfeit locus 1 family protein